MHLPLHMLPIALHSIGIRPSTFLHPPPAACRPRLPLTQQSPKMLDNFPPGCPPLQKKLCTALMLFLPSGCTNPHLPVPLHELNSFPRFSCFVEINTYKLNLKCTLLVLSIKHIFVRGLGPDIIKNFTEVGKLIGN